MGATAASAAQGDVGSLRGQTGRDGLQAGRSGAQCDLDTDGEAAAFAVRDLAVLADTVTVTLTRIANTTATSSRGTALLSFVVDTHATPVLISFRLLFHSSPSCWPPSCSAP